jgi:hypothetical protein
MLARPNRRSNLPGREWLQKLPVGKPPVPVPTHWKEKPSFEIDIIAMQRVSRPKSPVCFPISLTNRIASPYCSILLSISTVSAEQNIEYIHSPKALLAHDTKSHGPRLIMWSNAEYIAPVGKMVLS